MPKKKSHARKRKQQRRRPRQNNDMKQLRKTIYGASNVMVGGLGVLAIGKAASDTVASMVP
jgi:hypothetical protein